MGLYADGGISDKPAIFGEGSMAEAAVPIDRDERLARLLESADLLLADGGGERARIEALLREIDANFDAAQLPQQLAERRQRLIAAAGQR